MPSSKLKSNKLRQFYKSVMRQKKKKKIDETVIGEIILTIICNNLKLQINAFLPPVQEIFRQILVVKESNANFGIGIKFGLWIIVECISSGSNIEEHGTRIKGMEGI